jgi:type III restriction enzyme
VIVQETTPELITPSRMLSETPPYPFSRKLFESKKTVFNFVACDNEFELSFTKFLHRSEDVIAFSKLPQQFGFSIQYTDTRTNMRHYFPDFVVKLSDTEFWLIETKGREDVEVALKDQAAENWCENATKLTKLNWKYLKVNQNDFEKLHPDSFQELSIALAPNNLDLN